MSRSCRKQAASHFSITENSSLLATIFSCWLFWSQETWDQWDWGHESPVTWLRLTKIIPYTRSPLITGHDLKRKRAHFVRKCWNLFSSHKYPSIYGTVTPEFTKRLERCRRWWTRAGCLYLLHTHWNHRQTFRKVHEILCDDSHVLWGECFYLPLDRRFCVPACGTNRQVVLRCFCSLTSKCY